jgi:serine/threonine-protein phosphatase 2A regulatory subunit A
MRNSFLSSTVLQANFIDLIRKEEDEVLFAIAEELGKVFTLLENKLVLLPLLEALCCTDETVVREQAVKSLSKIAETLANPDIQNIVVPTVIRLATMEALPSRLSSIGLIASCYNRSGSQKEAMRK